MKPISASAPNKIHLAGEHSVVYGGQALMAPVEVNGRRNRITLEVNEVEEGEERVAFTGELGTATFDAEEKTSGLPLYSPMFQACRVVFARNEFTLAHSRKHFSFTGTYSGSPKGTGNSASIPAAMAAGLYAYFGHTPSKEALFEAAYAVDNVYHGGKSSGGDPRTVVNDHPLLFKKIFSTTGETFEYKDVTLSLPVGTSLLLIDTYRSGERASTSTMVSLFAEKKGITKPPHVMSQIEREAIVTPFNSILQRLLLECTPVGNPRILGGLLTENHGLLRSAGVSSEDIDACLTLAKRAGALGGKLIGAGGNGGAAIVYAGNEKTSEITSALSQEGFHVYPLRFSTRGAGLD